MVVDFLYLPTFLLHELLLTSVHLEHVAIIRLLVIGVRIDHARPTEYEKEPFHVDLVGGDAALHVGRITWASIRRTKFEPAHIRRIAAHGARDQCIKRPSIHLRTGMCAVFIKLPISIQP